VVEVVEFLEISLLTIKHLFDIVKVEKLLFISNFFIQEQIEQISFAI